MQLNELGLTSVQLKALEKKKITSVEALLRRPPFHYYDFSKTYPLDLSNKDTASMIEKTRPFAILGECVYFEI